ncbi:SNF2 family N-terminal domain-containing protein [Rhodofomes roseus]|uniref:SNF2 family N-terminal domain-containing protein n=1 Tax=Rhodofomes roseus TaxID=34475 RepID=A0ABQ8K303_9APHY|nr:SNF2 family N-terminal domain-containing protein [Rhodofomes roseus]KAH9830730.1 SNF2 family N-terminal domain-containing protein [Rhodofomes roseus]
MPAFQNPQAGAQKRKSDFHDPNSANRKRQAVGSTNEGWVGGGSSKEVYWMVQWRAPQYKKHKTWDGDAVMQVMGNSCNLFDMEGKQFLSGPLHGIESANALATGVNLRVGNKELEVDHVVSRPDFMSGKCFTNGRADCSSPVVSSVSGAIPKPYAPLRPKLMNDFKTPSRVTDSVPSRKAIELEAVDLVKGDRSASKGKAQDSFWTANWRKPQQKKHKTWDGDAYVSLRAEKITLISEKGMIVGAKKWDGLPLYSGYSTFIGGREVELDSQISEAELPTIVGSSIEATLNPELESPPQTPAQPSFLVTSRRDSADTSSSPSTNSPAALKKFVPPTSFYGKAPAKPKARGPLHDPNAEGAIVMKAPTKEHAAKHNKKNLPTVEVVIDPILARRLRPHQVEGVKFLYECVMGLRKHEGQGSILADEMGMGKTLQTIALCWTLLKQNPYAGAGPVVGKILIVCPVTLINNWKNEFHKWLGRDRVGVMVGDKDKASIKHFVNSKIHQVLIIGYERLRTVISDLAYCNPPIGLIICDEGHRLKSANNKTSTMFEALRTPRRIILSGTPIQNDLGEFHAMADFCNPGLLDDYNTFRRVYETPILKSRAPGCSAKETELGEARSAQLSAIARSFVLRREATILKKYLPPKHEYVVFVTPTKLQLAIFNKILSADKLDNLVRNSTAESLALINMLTKISNSPILLKATLDQAKNKAGNGDAIKMKAIEEAVTLLPNKARVEDVSLSGKLTALATLLRVLRERTDEKCIIVSHYTSTLNIVEAFCRSKNYSYNRLDGQTPPPKRQEYVNEFNKAPQAKRFVFLLSSKAGGVGLNLIGASRLVLIDSDWNPSHDLQSMARIHRDGQKRPVFIYRFLTAGAIDEKIYQRQVTKLGLSDSLMGNGAESSKSDSFTRKDLQDIFTIYPHTACHTHDLLECPCESSGGKINVSADEDRGEATDGESDEEEQHMQFMAASQVRPEQMNKPDKAYLKQKKAQLAALGEWTHIHCLRRNARELIQDDVLSEMLYSKPSNAKPGSTASQSRLERILEAVDLETVLAESGPDPTVDEVPGGTVSFLFERGSKALVDEDEEQPDDDSQTHA